MTTAKLLSGSSILFLREMHWKIAWQIIDRFGSRSLGESTGTSFKCTWKFDMNLFQTHLLHKNRSVHLLPSDYLLSQKSIQDVLNNILATRTQ